MTTVITDGTSNIFPTVVDGYTSERRGGTIVHEIIGSSAVDVTLRPAGLRTGTLILGFQGDTSEADSLAAEAVLAGFGSTFVLGGTDRTSIDMTFVVPSTGRIERSLEDATRDAWLVSVDFTEIPT